MTARRSFAAFQGEVKERYHSIAVKVLRNNPIGQIIQKQAHHPTHKIALFFPVKRADYVKGTFTSTDTIECPGDVLAMVTTLWTWPSESKNEPIPWVDQFQDKVTYVTEMQRRRLSYLLSFPTFFNWTAKKSPVDHIQPNQHPDVKPRFSDEELKNIWDQYANKRDAPQIAKDSE